MSDSRLEPPWLYEDKACKDPVDSPAHLLGHCSPLGHSEESTLLREWVALDDKCTSIDLRNCFPTLKTRKFWSGKVQIEYL